MDIKSIRIAEWNANDFINHKAELIQFPQDNKIDVLLISETHFTERTVFRIPYYLIYHTIHPDETAHGRTAIIVQNTISHHEAPPQQTNKMQAAIVHINAQQWSFDIAAMYSPPRHRIETEKYEALLDQLGNKIHYWRRLDSKSQQLNPCIGLGIKTDYQTYLISSCLKKSPQTISVSKLTETSQGIIPQL